MPNLTTVHLTAGLPDSGTGNVSTIDNMLGTAGTPSLQVLTVQGITSGQPLIATGTFSVGAITTGSVSVVQGGNTVAVKAANTAATTSDPSLVVAISPNSVNANGRAVPGNSAPVVLASQKYQTIPQTSSAVKMTGTATGAAGDWLDGILVVPGSTSPGAISIADGTGSAIIVFTGGSGSVTNLIPFFVPIGAISAAGAWSLTSGANVSVIVTGNFT